MYKPCCILHSSLPLQSEQALLPCAQGEPGTPFYKALLKLLDVIFSQTLYGEGGVSASPHHLVVSKRICVLSCLPKGLTPSPWHFVLFLPHGTETFSLCIFMCSATLTSHGCDKSVLERIRIISVQRKVYDS